jgi:hypothetical protein
MGDGTAAKLVFQEREHRLNNFMIGIRRECFVLYAKENPQVALEDIAVALGFDPEQAVDVADHFCRTEGLERPKGVVPVYNEETQTAQQKQQQAKRAKKKLKSALTKSTFPHD